MSQYQQTGISADYFNPLALGGSFIGTLAEDLEGYSHELDAFGGPDRASITLRAQRERLEDWYELGLGRHIEVNGPNGQVFEGFVNTVTLSLGSVQASRGPLLELGNRVQVLYSTVDTSTSPPAVGARVATAVANDAESQGRWGIVHKVISIGGADAADAAQIRDAWLAEHAEPETSERVSPGQGQLQAELEVLGYIHWLEAYVYNQTASTGTIAISTKLTDVLTASPNAGLFSTNYSEVTANALLVPRYEDDYRTAAQIVKALLARGDSSDNRMLLRLDPGRRAVYEPMPAAFEYQHRLGDNAQQVETLGGLRVAPWDVRAGRWMFLPDFLVGRNIPSSLGDDPRALFIEHVRYSAPYGITLVGEKASRLSQRLARLGLAGGAA